MILDASMVDWCLVGSHIFGSTICLKVYCRFCSKHIFSAIMSYLPLLWALFCHLAWVALQGVTDFSWDKWVNKQPGRIQRFQAFLWPPSSSNVFDDMFQYPEIMNLEGPLIAARWKKTTYFQFYFGDGRMIGLILYCNTQLKVSLGSSIGHLTMWYPRWLETTDLEHWEIHVAIASVFMLELKIGIYA